MAPSVANLEIDGLTVDDRIEFDRALCQEFECRLADHVADPEGVVPWEHIRSEALARWRHDTGG